MKPEAVVLPLENLKFIALPVAENKETWGEGIKLKTFLHQHSQPVNGFTKVRVSAGQINPLDTGLV